MSFPVGNVIVKRDESGEPDRRGIEVIQTSGDPTGSERKAVTKAGDLPRILTAHETETKIIIEKEAQVRKKELLESEQRIRTENLELATSLIREVVTGMHQEIRIAVHEQGKQNLRLLMSFQLNPQMAQEIIKKELGEQEPKNKSNKSLRKVMAACTDR